MTDRANALLVVLESDTREDDAESLCSAIRHMRGVLSVSLNTRNADSVVAEERANERWASILVAVLRLARKSPAGLSDLRKFLDAQDGAGDAIIRATALPRDNFPHL